MIYYGIKGEREKNESKYFSKTLINQKKYHGYK